MTAPSFLKWLLEDSTLPQLDTSTRSTFPHTRKRHRDVGSVKVIDFKHGVDQRDGEVRVDSRTRSNNGNVHIQSITLTNVEFDEHGEMEPVILINHNAKVFCDCMDFRFRFAYYNHKDRSLVGNPPPAYQRVPGSNRPPANPRETPGMCKHLMQVVNKMRSEDLVH